MRTIHNGRTYEWESPLSPTTVLTVNGQLRVDFAAISRNLELTRVLTLAGGFNPRQMRVPKGNDSGGQWIDGMGGLADGLSGASGSGGGTDTDGGTSGYPSPTLDAVAKNRKKPGRLEGKGTVDDPIYVGQDMDKAMDLLGEGKYVRIDSNDDDVKVLIDKLATEAKGTSMDICKVSVDESLFCAGTKGRPRVTMPQFSSKHPIPGSKAAKKEFDTPDDGGEVNMSDDFKADLLARGVKITTETRPAKNYLPAQSEMLASKSAGIAKALQAGKKMPGTVFVTEDGYVIDGHHRWAAVNLNSAQGFGDGMMDVEIVDMSITDVLHYANQWTEDMGLPHADIMGNPVASDAAKAADQRRAELIAFSVAQIMQYGGNPQQARVPKGNGARSGRWMHVVGAVISGLTGALTGLKPISGDDDAGNGDNNQLVSPGTKLPAFAGNHAKVAPDAVDKLGVPYGADVAANANKLYDKAEIAEPQITRDMQAMLGPNQELAGLAFRLKEPTSLAKKIRGDMIGDGKTVGESTAGMFDVNRYTALSDTANLAEDTKKSLATLQEQGYQVVQNKNTWGFPDPRNPYQGINVKLMSPQGQQIELQFHTPESLEVKEKMHSLYDDQKLTTKGSPEFLALSDEMMQMSKDLPVPPGIETVK